MTPDITAVHTPDYYKKWAPDLAKDPVHVWMDKYHILFPIAGAIALYAIGGMPYLVWGFFVRSVLVLHATWLVNSATHVWGYRSHETRDNSTNLWWVALLTFGEGWHNNHHAFQTSARHGLRWWEVDVTYWAIKVMEAVGMARNIKLPKITHSTPIASPVKAARAARKAARKRLKAGLPVEGQAEPELVASR
jgi:fatty-acid desaturase